MQTNSVLSLEVKRATNQGVITFYASTFGNMDAQGDIVERGAFAYTIKNQPTPALLWAHDQSTPIGAITFLKEDNHGLMVTAKLTLGTQKGAEALALLQDNAVKFSIGFKTAQDGAYIDSSGIRHITNIARLYEISVVAIPANDQAALISGKSLAENKRLFEHFLRTQGNLSRKEARRCASGVWGDCDGQKQEALKQMNDAILRLTNAVEKI